MTPYKITQNTFKLASKIMAVKLKSQVCASLTVFTNTSVVYWVRYAPIKIYNIFIASRFTQKQQDAIWVSRTFKTLISDDGLCAVLCIIKPFAVKTNVNIIRDFIYIKAKPVLIRVLDEKLIQSCISISGVLFHPIYFLG